MKKVLDYLIKVSAAKKDELFSAIAHEQMRIHMKLEGAEEVHSVRFRKTIADEVFVIQFRGNEFSENQIVTFKLDFESKLYFFKTESIGGTKSVHINKKQTEIYELVRRKEKRYRMPSEWPQVGLITLHLRNPIRAIIAILEMSSSGMKLRVTPELPKFEVGQTIKLQFKVYKRGQVLVNGIIRHSRKNKSGGPTMGIEFEDMSPMLELKIQNICDDLAYYHTHHSRYVTS